MLRRLQLLLTIIAAFVMIATAIGTADDAEANKRTVESLETLEQFLAENVIGKSFRRPKKRFSLDNENLVSESSAEYHFKNLKVSDGGLEFDVLSIRTQRAWKTEKDGSRFEVKLEGLTQATVSANRYRIRQMKSTGQLQGIRIQSTGFGYPYQLTVEGLSDRQLVIVQETIGYHDHYSANGWKPGASRIVAAFSVDEKGRTTLSEVDWGFDVHPKTMVRTPESGDPIESVYSEVVNPTKSEAAAANQEMEQKDTEIEKDVRRQVGFASAPVADDFALVKFDKQTGEAWFHDEEMSWRRFVQSEDTSIDRKFMFVVAPYVKTKSVGGIAVDIGLSDGTRSTPTYTVFRIDTQSGETWVRSDGIMKPIEIKSESDGSSHSGPYRLVCARIGDHFALYRYSKSTGELWAYTDRSMHQIATEELPTGNYEYRILPIGTHGEESKSKSKKYNLLRLDETSGSAWIHENGIFRSTVSD